MGCIKCDNKSLMYAREDWGFQPNATSAPAGAFIAEQGTCGSNTLTSGGKGRVPGTLPRMLRPYGQVSWLVDQSRIFSK